MTVADHCVAAAEAAYRAGRFAEAAAMLEQLPDTGPAHQAALRVLGMCRFRLGQHAAALDLLERARRLVPTDPWAMLYHGMVLLDRGRQREAADLFRRCTALLPNDAAPWVNLSAASLALGDAAAAIRAGRRARLRAPKMAAAHYTLGRAYLAGGFAARAIQSLREATRLAPDFADAWVELGGACYQDGAIFDAIDATRAALSAQPEHEAGIANLSVFLRLTGWGEQAGQILARQVATRPDLLAAKLNMVADLLADNEAEAALALLGGVPPRDVDMRHAWLLQRAAALINLHRTEDAAAALAELGEVPPRLEPLMHWRRVLLASTAGDVAAARDAAAAMEAALERASGMVPEHRIMAHFDLARFWRQQGEIARNFGHWAQGHRLLGKIQPFSRAQYGGFVDASIAAVGKTRLSGGARASNADATPVFIVGMPRSGTTLMEQILASHAKVFGAGERIELPQTFRMLGGALETASAAERVAGLGRAALDEAATTYLRALHALAPDAPRITDKMPTNFRYLGLVALMLPGARIIACERDPRDIGLSIFTHRFYGVHSYAHDLGDLGWYVGQQQKLMAHWRANLPNPILVVNLTDWIEDFSGTLVRVLDFLDLPYDSACETFYQHQRTVRTVSRMQVRQPVNARGLGRWRQYAAHLEPLIAELRAAKLVDGAEGGM
jgi:tetratricopeptide (TPR) repeat protein